MLFFGNENVRCCLIFAKKFTKIQNFPLPSPVCGPHLVLLELGPNKQSLQTSKSAIIIISGSTYNAHTEPLFKKLEICQYRT